jgi:hypothetical protein
MEDARHIRAPMEPQNAPRPERRRREAGETDRAMARLAGRQHGLVARRQLRDLGMSPAMVKKRIGRGALHVVHRGVYAVGHRNLTMEGRWMAAVLAFGPHAVLSHRSAGQLWGLVPRGRIAPEVTRPGRAGDRPHLVVHRSTLPGDEIVRVRGIPVTSVPRTMFDLAGMLKEREVERAWNEMEVREYTDRLSVPHLLARYPGRKGSVLLARLANRKTLPVGITRNDLEEAFLYEVDCLWDEERVAIELDGGGAHGTTRAFQKDRERDRILLAEGYRPARVTWDQIHETPTEVAADLRQILTSYPSTNGPGALRPLPAR